MGSVNMPGSWRIADGFQLEAFLERLLVARLATSGRNGPTVRPVWYPWEQQRFWFLTGSWSSLERLVQRDPRVALVIDTCDLSTGEIWSPLAAMYIRHRLIATEPVGGAVDTWGPTKPMAAVSLERLRGPEYPVRRAEPNVARGTATCPSRPPHPGLPRLANRVASSSIGAAGLTNHRARDDRPRPIGWLPLRVSRDLQQEPESRGRWGDDRAVSSQRSVSSRVSGNARR
jgi:Pyridoxamine 5'-phosphate oxidase